MTTGIKLRSLIFQEGLLRSISLDDHSIDVSRLESGTYFVRLKDGDRVGVVKFVKI